MRNIKKTKQKRKEEWKFFWGKKLKTQLNIQLESSN